ncbi:hypothetical protein Droror1_Dr00008383 [Drosera rotundifolia]
MRAAIKPTSTTGRKQNTVTRDKLDMELIARGRHDPCVVPRAMPMVEAQVALVLVDQLMAQYAQYEFPELRTPRPKNPNPKNLGIDHSEQNPTKLVVGKPSRENGNEVRCVNGGIRARFRSRGRSRPPMKEAVNGGVVERERGEADKGMGKCHPDLHRSLCQRPLPLVRVLVGTKGLGTVEVSMIVVAREHPRCRGCLI